MKAFLITIEAVKTNERMRRISRRRRSRRKTFNASLKKVG